MPAQAREARVRVGVVPQFDNLDPDFTVTENLLVFGSYFGLSQQECRARVGALLDNAALHVAVLIIYASLTVIIATRLIHRRLTA